MRIFFQLLLAFLFLFAATLPAVSQPSKRVVQQRQSANPAKETHSAVAKLAQPQFTYTIIAGANGTFGYDVYADGRLKLHQPSVPAMPGNDGFKTKAAAGQVAQLAIKKMQQGESLPTISPAELKKLRAI